MNVRIRDAHQHELEALLHLYRHLHATDSPVPEKQTLREVWNEILSDPKIYCLVVDLNGELIASCILVVVPNLTRGASPYGLIENVVTHEAYRRHGVGTQLMRHALDLAWSKNCYKVMLLTGSKREEIHYFYEQAGFAKGDKTGFVAKP